MAVDAFGFPDRKNAPRRSGPKLGSREKRAAALDFIWDCMKAHMSDDRINAQLLEAGFLKDRKGLSRETLSKLRNAPCMLAFYQQEAENREREMQKWLQESEAAHLAELRRLRGE